LRILVGGVGTGLFFFHALAQEVADRNLLFGGDSRRGEGSAELIGICFLAATAAGVRVQGRGAI